MSGSGNRRRVWWQVVLAVVAGGLVAISLVWIWPVLGDRSRLQAWMVRFGPWGPLVSIGLNVIQVLVAPVPGQVVGVLNGYLYGLWPGTLYSMLGLLIGTGLAMGLARRFGRPLVERLVNAEQLDRWDRLADRQGVWFFFLVFLIPSLPDDLVCFVVGLSRLPLPTMLVLAMIGRLPGVFVSCWFGARSVGLPWWAWLVLGCGATAVAGLFWRFRERTEDVLVGLVQRLVGRSQVR